MKKILLILSILIGFLFAQDVITSETSVVKGGTIGDAGGTVEIASSDWAIDATGDATGLGAISADGLLTLSRTEKVISAGSYSSRLTMLAGQTNEMVTIAGLGEEDDFLIGYGSYLRTTGEDGKGFGASFLVEATNTTGTPTLQGLQSMAFIGSVGGTEAAVLKSMNGDATAGAYGIWAKVGSNTNVNLASGSRTAPIWVDNQHMANTNNGEEYGIFATTGGTRPDAFVGFETSSSGWDYLFYFDETAYDQAPVSTMTPATNTNAADGSLIINLNGTDYYIPYYGIGKD